MTQLRNKENIHNNLKNLKNKIEELYLKIDSLELIDKYKISLKKDLLHCHLIIENTIMELDID